MIFASSSQQDRYKFKQIIKNYQKNQRMSNSKSPGEIIQKEKEYEKDMFIIYSQIFIYRYFHKRFDPSKIIIKITKKIIFSNKSFEFF